jgi:pyruvate/2-oxoglutarate dehydrogenase complex dihydrolipoamide acyltransferase (E2) component
MSISLELSTIQQKNAERAWLSEGIESFLASGGKVIEAPGFVSKPLPALRFNSGTGRERTEPQLPTAAPALNPREARIAKLREMAKTMTVREAAEEMGVSRNMIRILGKENHITFQSGRKFAVAAFVERMISPEQDAKDAERLRAFCSAGATLHQAAAHMGYGKRRVQRLADTYGIELVLRMTRGIAK